MCASVRQKKARPIRVSGRYGRWAFRTFASRVGQVDELGCHDVGQTTDQAESECYRQKNGADARYTPPSEPIDDRGEGKGEQDGKGERDKEFPPEVQATDRDNNAASCNN